MASRILDPATVGHLLPVSYLEGFISPEIFIYIFIIPDSNLTQTLMLNLKAVAVLPQETK